MSLTKVSLDFLSKILLAGTMAIICLQVAALVYWLNQLPPEIPLFYSLPWGSSRLATPIWLLIIPIFSSSVVIVNFGISLILHQNVLTKILSSGALLVSLLALITLIKIILLGLP